eukprot:SAG31_NODE_48556_length_182_cov_8.746988_1_plen_28_part_10
MVEALFPPDEYRVPAKTVAGNFLLDRHW